MSSGESFTINSEHSKVAFKKYVDELFEQHRYITFNAPRIGADRSVSQNALFHVWCSEYVAYRMAIHRKEVSKGLLAGMKRIVKKRFTASHPESQGWMVYEVVNPFNGQSKKDYTSSKDWKRGEMFTVLTWLQMVAAEDGLILESRGEFAKLTREHNGD